MTMRILHTMLRVGDLERSIAFYTRVLGMRAAAQDRAARAEATRWRSSATATKRDGAVLELTHNHGVDRYDIGTAYGHVAIEVPDAAAVCDAVRAASDRRRSHPRGGAR